MAHELTIRDIILDVDFDDRAGYLKGEVEATKFEMGNFYDALEADDDSEAIEHWRAKVLDRRMEYYNEYLKNKSEKPND